jgi:WD40 repeat protein
MSSWGHLSHYTSDTRGPFDNPTPVVMSADGRFLAAASFRGEFDEGKGGVVMGHDLTVVDLRRHTSHTLRDDLACPAGGGPLTIAVSDQFVVLGGCGPFDATCDCFHSVVQMVGLSSWPWRIEQPVRVDDGPVPRFSPDGKILAVFAQGGLQVFDVDRSGLHARRRSSPAGRGSCFNFAGVCLGNTSQSPIALGAAQHWTGTFTPDSRTLVLDRGNGVIELVPTARGNTHSTVLALSSVEASCTDFLCGSSETLGVSPDGRLLASNGSGEIRLWDLPSHQLIGALLVTGLGGAVFTKITRTTLTLDDRLGIGLAVDLAAGSWERDACTIANRNLTRAEWVQYAGSVPYRSQCPAIP